MKITNMTFTSEDKGDHLLIRSVGVVENKEDLFRHAELVYEEIIKYDKRKIFLDLTQTQLPLDIVSYYKQVEFFSENLPDVIRLWKIALVLLPEFAGFGKFWETVAVNRGYDYHTFTSFEKALAWLLK